MSVIKRRMMLGGAASVLGASYARGAYAQGADAAPEQAKIELAAVRDTQLGVQVAVADALGLFKRHGLEVTVHWTQSGADIITFLAGGAQYVAAGGSFSEIVLASQKLPVRIIAALADMAGTQGLALAPGVKITEPSDMVGKRFAFTQGTPNALILSKLGAMQGFDPSKVTLVNMEPSEGITAALHGDVQGILSFEPFLYRLTQAGGTLYATGTQIRDGDTMRPLKLADRLIYVHSALLAAQSWIADKPNTMKALLLALVDATAVVNQDRPHAVDIMCKLLHLDVAAATKIMSENSYSLAIDAGLARSIAFQSAWAVDIKRIPAPVTGQQVIDARLLKQVDPSLVNWVD